MNFIRNTIGILVGLLVATVIISLGIRINPDWITYDRFTPFQQWERFLQSMRGHDTFFAYLLFVSGVASSVGGVVTAMIVKYAKVAYAILIGFIWLFIAVLDIVLHPYHPTFYKILIFLTFFPFAWMGGKITEVIYDRRNKRLKRAKN